MSGIFDWLRRRLHPGPPGLPAPESRAMIPAMPLRRGGLLDLLALRPPEAVPGELQALPPPPLLEAFGPPAALPVVPEPEAPPSPEEPSLFETFFAPDPEAQGPSPIEALVPAPPAEEMSPWAAMARPLTPSEATVPQAVEDWTREFPDVLESTRGRTPLWILRDLGWLMPPTLELVEEIRSAWDLPLIFEEALLVSEDPRWRRAVQESAHRGEPAEMEIMLISGGDDPYGEAARFLGVPDTLIEAYAGRTDGDVLLWSEVLRPLHARFSKAMDVLKPQPLRGWFDIEPGEDGMLWLKYKEALFREPTA